MTREEEIKKQAEKKALEPSRLMHPYANQYKVMSAYEIGFIEGAVWADAHPHWISVDDELPKGFAIITNGDDVLVGKYNFEKGLWGVRNKTMFAYTLLPANWKVTHWMPLPQPPHHFADVSKKVKKGGEE